MAAKKETRFFTQIYDDILRSPHLTGNEVRLYGIMLSYCNKGKGARVCKLTKKALAGEMKVSQRTIYNALRKLEKQGLIEIRYAEGDHRLPLYVMVDDPPVQAPEKLRSNKLKDAHDYVNDAGGVRKLQRKAYKPRKATRKTGRPESFTNGFELVDPDDVPVDVPAHQPDDRVSLIASPTGNGLPEGMAMGCQSTSNGLPVPMAMGCQSTGNGLPPCTEKNREQVRERSNDLREQGHRGDLALPSPAPRCAAQPNQVGTKTSVRRAAANENDDPGDDADRGVEVAQPSKEELEAARARQRALRKGTRSSITDVPMAEKKSKSDAPRASKKRRGAGAPVSKKDETKDVVDKHLTHDPDAVSEVPSKPWPLYWHFRDSVRKKFPEARLPDDPNPKYLKWGKDLLKDYSTSDLYEMIRVLVLDYENINASRIFFKFSGTPTPTYEQFFSNRDMLATFIGTGVISPPAVRFSAYADDYNKRHGKTSTSADDQSGRTDVDPLEALRDQVNG